MLELLVLKKYAECTSQRLKRTSGARVMTQKTLKQYVNKVNVNKVNVQVKVNKVNKVNVKVQRQQGQRQGQRHLLCS